MKTLFLMSFLLFQAPEVSLPPLPNLPNVTIDKVADTFAKELAADKSKCLVTQIRLDTSVEYQGTLIGRIQELEKEIAELKAKATTPAAAK